MIEKCGGMIVEAQRQTIFISHATPDDNQFAIWLAMRLLACGYRAWCDVRNLSKGGDFWNEIECRIRNDACKFLLVQSKISNARDGVKQEIAVAQKVKKQLGDTNFIIPLRIDPDLSYDDISVDVIRLNSIDFTESWAKGLTELVQALTEQQCPKSLEPVTGCVNMLNAVMHGERMPVKREETFDSNWFGLQNIPSVLYFHPYRKEPEIHGRPFLTYKNHLVSFLSADGLPCDLAEELSLETESRKYEIPVFLKMNADNEFIKLSDFHKLVTGLLAKVFDASIREHKGLRTRPMSKAVAFWYPQGVLEKDKVGRIQLIGIHKQYKWHFAITGSVKLFPMPMVQIGTHVLFTTDGQDMSLSDAVQHAARRSIGRRWWNKDWRARMLAFIKSLANPETEQVDLEVGVPSPLRMEASPITFLSQVSYDEPIAADDAAINNAEIDDEMDGEGVE